MIHQVLSKVGFSESKSSLIAPPWGQSTWCPSGDLNKVLKYLSSDSFELLEGILLRTISMKVLFLVALATANGVWELQARF